MAVGPTHVLGGTLDLVMTDVSGLVRVAVVAPIGYSDYFYLSAIISMAQAVPNLCVSRRVFLKHYYLEYSLWCNMGSAIE